MQTGRGDRVSPYELMEAKLAMTIERVRKLEVIFAARQVLTSDEREAERIAGTLGFTVEVILLSRGNQKYPERIALAKELRARHWPASRIARVMNCCERTVGRYFK